ncbi:MAG: hypothetical protein PHS04_05010 [Tissierellia bacterium]|nr:hypothetical protein [Tissierellia bacterium]
MGFFKNLFGSKDNASSDSLAKAAKLEKVGRFGEAIAIYTQYIQDNRGAYEVYELLANAYGKNGQWAEGMKVAKEYDNRFSYYKLDWSHHFIIEAQERIDNPNKVSTKKRNDNKPKEVMLLDDGSVTMNGKVIVPVQPIVKETAPKPQEPKLALIPQQVIPAKKKKEITPKYPTKANYKRVLMENLGDKLEELKSKLPEYDFYTGDNSSLISDDVREAIINLQFGFEDLMLKAQDYEKNKDFASAASVYEKMVGMKCILREPYERLMAIYEKAELNADFKEFVEYSFRFFSDRALNDRNYIRAMAQKYDCFDLAETLIEKGKVVAYFDGLFDIYNPFPWLYDWNKKRF